MTRGALGDAELGEHFLCGRLLRGLLRTSLPDAGLLAVDVCRAGEGAVVRRAVDVQHRVVDGLPTPRQCFLELRLEVDVACQGVFDPAREGADDRGFDLLLPVLEK